MENENGIIKLTRQQIYDDIWKLSVAGVARKYNLQYARLIKSCREADIPFPSSGYWARKNFGKDVSAEVIPLSGDGSLLVNLWTNDSFVKSIKRTKVEERKNVQEELSVTQNKSRLEKKSVEKETVTAHERSGMLEFLDEEERRKVLSVACSLEISENTRLHRALVQYKKQISEYNVELKNVQNQRYYNKSKNEPEFFKEVSKEGTKRLMAILDALFKAVEKLGGSVNDDLSMRIRNDVVRIRVAETKEKIKYDDYKLLSEEEKKGYNVYPKLQVYNVFNVAQTNLQEARPDLYKKLADEGKQIRPQSEGEDFSFAPIDRMIKDNEWICPIKPTYGDNAYYSISKNEIVVPEKKQFKDGESFYTNLGHEMAHSTGAENQLGRLQPTSFGSKEYAREELVAELSAALVAQRYGMTKHLKEDSASYLKSWLDSLNESPEFIKTTLTDVKKASSMITKCIDAMQQKIDQEQNIEVVQSNSQEPVYYASVAYLQMGEDTDRLDKLQEKGDYEALLKEAIEYDAGDAIDLSNTYLSPTKYRGDDLLVENEHYAVVYNPSVGGTYDVMRKVTAEEVRQNITRYGLPDNATADVKSITGKQEQKMETVAQEETHYFHRGR